MYCENAIVSVDENAGHNELCYAGVARISCRLVYLSKCISLALKLGNKVKKECAAILENLKVYLLHYFHSLDSRLSQHVSPSRVRTCFTCYSFG